MQSELLMHIPGHYFSLFTILKNPQLLLNSYHSRKPSLSTAVLQLQGPWAWQAHDGTTPEEGFGAALRPFSVS